MALRTGTLSLHRDFMNAIFNRCEQPFEHYRFQYAFFNAELGDLARIVRFTVTGEYDELRVVLNGFDQIGHLNTVHNRHANVGYDNIRSMLFEKFHTRFAVFGEI